MIQENSPVPWAWLRGNGWGRTRHSPPAGRIPVATREASPSAAGRSWLDCLASDGHGSEAPVMAPSPADGGAPDPGALFDRYQERLRRTVRLRLDRRLSGVVDS